MGMASSRRYGMQEITLVTTSNASDWEVQNAISTSPISWRCDGINYRQIKMGYFNSLKFDLSKNTASVEIRARSNGVFTHFMCDAHFRSEQMLFTEVRSLDLSKTTTLIHLRCGGNPLLELDISNNILLTTVSCWGVQLSKLDVSKNVALTTLDCTQNPKLTTIYVNQRQLDKLNGTIPSDLKWYKDTHTQYVLKQ